MGTANLAVNAADEGLKLVEPSGRLKVGSASFFSAAAGVDVVAGFVAETAAGVDVPVVVGVVAAGVEEVAAVVGAVVTARSVVVVVAGLVVVPNEGILNDDAVD